MDLLCSKVVYDFIFLIIIREILSLTMAKSENITH